MSTWDWDVREGEPGLDIHPPHHCPTNQMLKVNVFLVLKNNISNRLFILLLLMLIYVFSLVFGF